MQNWLKAILATVSLAALTWATPGCGSEATDRPRPETPSRLTAPERAAAEAGREAIRSYCRRLGLHLAGRRGPPEERARRRAVEGARTLASLARRKPQTPFAPGQTLRQLAADTAEDLEGTNCSAGLVAELERGL